MRFRIRNLLGLVFCAVVMLGYLYVFLSAGNQRFVSKLLLQFSKNRSHLVLKSQITSLDISKQLCLGNGIKPVLPKSSKVLNHLEFRQEKFEFLENFKNPCFYRNVTYYKNKPVTTPVKALRCLPYFFLIGVPKCGTTDIWNGLTLHPDIAARHIKEPFYIDLKRFPPYNWSLDQYLDVFHKTTGKIASYPSPNKTFGDNKYYHMITGDGSIGAVTRNNHWYLVPGNERCNEPRILNADLLRHLNPNLKLIISLRNPIDMAYSHYIFGSRIHKEKINVRDFHQNVLDSIRNHTDCRKYFSKRGCAYNDTLDTYKAGLRHGMYHVFLEDWFRIFPANQIMIVYFEEYMKQRVSVMQQMYKFLDLKPLSLKDEIKQEKRKIANLRRKEDKDIGDMMDETRIILENFFAPFNERLASLLNDKKFLWRS